jgi:hypothetical protein
MEGVSGDTRRLLRDVARVEALAEEVLMLKQEVS